jgi:hypothetical protein
VTLFGLKFTKSDVLVAVVILFAFYLLVIGVCLLSSIASIDGDESVSLMDNPCFRIWLEGCIADGLDPIESCVSWINYENGPPILVKPSRIC